jgi:hypothetical protein
MIDKNTRVEAPKPASGQRQMSSETPRDNAGLQYRYGTIGIEAVAAAARYCGPAKKTTEPATRIDQRFEQAG